MKLIENISETKYQHISGFDGLPLYVLRIEPEDPKEIKGIVQIIHGKNEHKGRYVEFMRYLASHGYLTIANDHRGHGESVLNPADRGYLYEGGYFALIEDVHEITLEVKQYVAEKCGQKKLPLMLLGHSMGSMAARCYIRKYDDEIDKLCILGCPSKSDMVEQGLIFLKILQGIRGKKARSKLANLVIMGLSYEMKFREEHLHNAWTNTQREAVIAHNNDPLCNYSFTLSGYEDMLRMSILTYSKGYHPKNPDLPIRFFSGEDDPCAISKEKLAEAMYLLKCIGYHDIRGKRYKNMRHDILHEKNKTRVYRDILKFMES